MQQRRLRLGDILDDYCPRERRITNHAVVAMIEDQVKQTRCTTCDADHEYKQARVPLRKKKEPGAAPAEGSAGPRPRAAAAALRPPDDLPAADEFVPGAEPDVPSLDTPEPLALAADAPPTEQESIEDEGDARDPADEDGPVHRRLIRATLPRPEGQTPEWKDPEFTVRQPGSGRGGFDANRNGHRPARAGRRGARAHGLPSGNESRFGGPRQGNVRHGGQHGQGGNRGGRPGQGPGQGHGQSRGRQGGQGRKRGR
jgi:translation initiation factor IF-2